MDLVRRFTEVNERLCEQRLKLRRSEKNAAAPPAGFADALGAETLNEISSLLGSQDFSKTVDFDALETAVRSAAMRFAAGILESYLNKDRSDCQGLQLRCECGALARYCGVREKSFVTVVAVAVAPRLLSLSGVW